MKLSLKQNTISEDFFLCDLIVYMKGNIELLLVLIEVEFEVDNF